MASEHEEGLHVVAETDLDGPDDTDDADRSMSAAPGDDALDDPLDDALDDGSVDGQRSDDGDLPADSDLESLRDAFVDAFNGRDLDALTALVRADVEVPDGRGGDGVEALTDEVEGIWERAPGAILTRAFLRGQPCAVGWLPDEDGCWSRAALVCFDSEDGLLSLVALPEDAQALDDAEAEDPTGDELDEWVDWAEWDRGEESDTRRRR